MCSVFVTPVSSSCSDPPPLSRSFVMKGRSPTPISYGPDGKATRFQVSRSGCCKGGLGLDITSITLQNHFSLQFDLPLDFSLHRVISFPISVFLVFSLFLLSPHFSTSIANSTLSTFPPRLLLTFHLLPLLSYSRHP